MSEMYVNLFHRSNRPTVNPNRERRIANEVLATCGPTMRSAVVATAAYFDVEPWNLLTRRRPQKSYRWRAVAIAVVRSRSSLSLPEIGRRLGGYDHTTILHAIRRADRDAVAAVCLLLDEVRDGACNGAKA